MGELFANSSGGVSSRGAKMSAKGAVTPMMAQYFAIKNKYADYLLFYRMGDFYELFFEDAVSAAAALDIALTKRGRHLNKDIPMCGVPVHSSEAYLQKLIRKGFKVAICEQMEDPKEAKKRDSKAVVKRDVIRLVTPGTLTEDALLDARRHNYLAAVGVTSGGADMALAWLDMSTGDFHVVEVDKAGLGAELSRLDPGEVLVPEPFVQNGSLGGALEGLGDKVSLLARGQFDSDMAGERLKTIFGVNALEGFGSFGRAETAACSALISYVELTQMGHMPALKPPQRKIKGSVLAMDAATRRNLELIRTLSGEHKGSVLSVIDQTVTGAGARLLQQRLVSPLTDSDAIERRFNAVEHFIGHRALRDNVRGTLKQCPDMARALSRLHLGRSGPRDLAAIRDGLKVAHEMRRSIEADQAALPAELAEAVQGLGDHQDLTCELARALVHDLPSTARDGGFIAEGYDSELDEARRLRDDSRRVIASLQSRYAKSADIKSLKIRYNNILGYFIEVAAQYTNKMQTPPLAETFIHRQTLANAGRFTTVELGEIDSRISLARDQALTIEQKLFDNLARLVTDHVQEISRVAEAIAVIDVSAALGQLAVVRRYTRPVLETSNSLDITQGRHVVLEEILERQGKTGFVANDCALGSGKDAARIWLVTGPNMAGKSTFLRQNALIVILAQMGSYVPAGKARLGIVDRLFSRVGAADDLARGRSTFMVEMVETAAILNQATPRSLVILDEVGRGTATFDGLSIAWACVEHLHETNACRALFATHYHELTALAHTLDDLTNVTMKVREWKDGVVFLHEVITGVADRSYGIQVAKLAGFPPHVITRAGEVLSFLEDERRTRGPTSMIDDLPLFSSAAQNEDSEPSEVEKALAAVHPDDLTPRDALDFVYKLRALLKPT